MQRVDLVIIGVLVLAAAGSALGVVTYEDDRRAAFRVAWTTSEEAIEVPVTGGPGGGMEGTIEVAATNVTRALWAVTVTGGPARITPVQVRVEVTAPDNSTGETEGELPAGPTSSVDLEVPLELAPTPSIETWEGATLEDARARLQEQATTTNGTGTWRIRVELALGGPVGAPESIETEISAVFTTYTATLSPETPEVSRG